MTSHLASTALAHADRRMAIRSPTRRRLLVSAAALPLLLNQAACLALTPGMAAAAVDLPGLDSRVNLATLQGQVVLLDFWASWCPPCRLSFPWMDEMLTRFEAQGLAVVAVNLDRQRRAAEQFLRAVPTRARIAFDPAGDTARRYGVRTMPTSCIIGRDGRLRLQHDGFRETDRAPLEAALLQALKT